jgi:hypothetical protein
MTVDDDEDVVFCLRAVLSMPEIKCSDCGNLISLPSTAYQNVENAVLM